MEIICIIDFKSTPIQHELTYLKKYKNTNDPKSDFYQIMCDNGTIQFYSKRIFMKLEDYREWKLNEII